MTDARSDERGDARRGEAGSDADGADGGPTPRDPRRLTVVFAAIILTSSLVPVPGSASAGGGVAGTLPAWVGLTDPFHLVGYAVLTVLASRALGRDRRGVLLAAGTAVAFGFGIELVQSPIPWRSFAWRDAAVNAVGAVGAALLVGAVEAVRSGRGGTPSGAGRGGEPR